MPAAVPSGNPAGACGGELPRRGLNAFTVLVIAVSTLGGLLFGLDSGSTGAAVEMDGFRAQMGWPSAHPEGLPTCGSDAYHDPSRVTGREGIILFTFHLGALIGAPIGGELSDRYGRRATIFLACMLFAVGSLWQAFSGAALGCSACTYRDMILGRLLGGLGLGFMLTTVPVYLSELSPPQFRGAAVTCFQVANNTGILLCAAFNVWAAEHFNGWRYALALQAGPAAVIAACVALVLPESPRYLARRGADDRALQVLSRLCAGSEKASELAAAELGDIKAELAELEAAGSLSWRELFRGSTLTSLLCGVGICMTQNITCICYFINFSPVIISNLCLSPWVGSLGLNGINLLATIVSVFVVDRFGRKVVLMWGTYVICTAFLVNALLFTAVPDLLENRPVALVMLAWVFIFMAAFGLSWGPCGWLVPSEVFPLNVRGKGMALATSFNMLASILFGDFGPNFVSSPDVLGVTGAWWLMTAIVFFWVLPVATFILPETRGLTLEQMTGAFAYCYGGDGRNNCGTMTEFFRKNAREAWEVSCPRRALLHKI